MNTTKFIVTFFAMAAAGLVSAAPLTLLGPGDAGWVSVGQPDQGPCVIGDPSCNGDIGFTLLPVGGMVDSYTEMSPVYTVAEITAVAGNVFSIGIDINLTGGGTSDHQLNLFSAVINGMTEFIYDGGAILADNITNPGTGFSDFVLAGFDLTNFDPSDEIKFFLDMDDVDAGREQFFLIAGGDGDDDDDDDDNGVPEPGPLALLGLGLLIMGLRSIKRS